MPMSMDELIARADELAGSIENYEPTEEDYERAEKNYRHKLMHAVMRRGFAERDLAEAVAEARENNMSWALIGDLLGVSGQAASKKYGAAKSAGGSLGERVVKGRVASSGPGYGLALHGLPKADREPRNFVVAALKDAMPQNAELVVFLGDAASKFEAHVQHGDEPRKVAEVFRHKLEEVEH
ncbi:hypothetical protein CLV56_3456 [Mumia flava]|uniref:Uncharacterized protein n=1 Tax=Mumia flava TaxID=1348852 RepID=A0A2M9B7N5_9ACTN|nr:hypothetical protein [Mumia flava]PJJ53954.1 hypothetical protein CLV56_3456 [Mumia flava]